MEEKIFGKESLMVCRIEMNKYANLCYLFLEKISLITSEECMESNVIPIEAKKFLEEETAAEALNNIAVNNEQDGDEEDLVCRILI